MKQEHYDRLLKLLALTTSANDNEALSAMRAANAILARYKLTWEQFIHAVQINAIRQAQRARSQSRVIFNTETVYARAPGNTTGSFTQTR